MIYMHIYFFIFPDDSSSGRDAGQPPAHHQCIEGRRARIEGISCVWPRWGCGRATRTTAKTRFLHGDVGAWRGGRGSENVSRCHTIHHTRGHSLLVPRQGWPWANFRRFVLSSGAFGVLFHTINPRRRLPLQPERVHAERAAWGRGWGEIDAPGGVAGGGVHGLSWATRVFQYRGAPETQLQPW